MGKLTVLLPTYNNASIIRNCLESIKWADEILVCDSYSTDATLDIAREYNVRIIQHEYLNSALQKNWAAPQCLHEWILQIDTDEVLEEGMREEIQTAVTSAPADLHAYRIPRKNFLLGRWMKHAGVYPDYQTRLFRKDMGRWVEREVHAHVIVPGRVGQMQGHIIHYGTPTLSKLIRNLDRYTRYEADELRKSGRIFRLYQLLLRPPLIFAWSYLWQGGWKDGWRGYILCIYLAFYDFMSYAKLWELEELNLNKSPR